MNSRLPGWQPWNVLGINGQGILSLPGYVEQGICTIWVNNWFFDERDTNVDTILLRGGDVVRINNYRYRLPEVYQANF